MVWVIETQKEEKGYIIKIWITKEDLWQNRYGVFIII